MPIFACHIFRTWGQHKMRQAKNSHFLPQEESGGMPASQTQKSRLRAIPDRGQTVKSARSREAPFSDGWSLD